MSTVLLDSHVLYWWSSDSERLSAAAARAIARADRLAVASISWFELAWQASHGRIDVPLPIAPWLEELSRQVQTIPTTPAIAHTAVSLPVSFPSDPMDRIIYATAIEQGWPLITKDERLRNHRHRTKVAIW